MDLAARRLNKELKLLKKKPTNGDFVVTQTDSTKVWTAVIFGPDGTPYENGSFHITINFPDNYPFMPPLITFTTKIYHPNIDTEGRICLDLLKCEPFGNWAPAMCISNVLASIRMLLANPNPHDPLMPNIAEEYMFKREKYILSAKSWTQNYANNENTCKRRKAN